MNSSLNLVGSPANSQFSLKQWMLSPAGAFTTAAVLTAMVLAESIAGWTPWAPFAMGYGLLTLLIPIWLKAYTFRPTQMHGKALWKLSGLILVIAVAIDFGVFGLGVDWVLLHTGWSGDPFYSLTLATNSLIDAVALSRQWSITKGQLVFAFCVLVWAPVAEELFYRGYLYGALKAKFSKPLAWFIASTFFGVRHVTHFFYLWPGTISVAGVLWCMAAFVFSIYSTYLYERSGGLLPVMWVHFLTNIGGLALAL